MDRDSRIFCVGLNYADHAAENRIPPPDSPVFFAKLASVAIGHEQPIPLSAASLQVDYEAELAFMVGRKVLRVTENQASRSIAGYTILNDVTARDLQFHDKQWFRGKNCDGFAPLGPWLVTRDEVADADNLVCCLLNTLTNSEQERMLRHAPSRRTELASFRVRA